MNSAHTPSGTGIAQSDQSAHSQSLVIAVCGPVGTRPLALFALLAKWLEKQGGTVGIQSNSHQMRQTIDGAMARLNAGQWPEEPVGPSGALGAEYTVEDRLDSVSCEFRVGALGGSSSAGDALTLWRPVLARSGVIIVTLAPGQLIDAHDRARIEAIAGVEEVLRVAREHSSQVILALSTDGATGDLGSAESARSLHAVAPGLVRSVRRLTKMGLLTTVAVSAPATTSEMGTDGRLRRVPAQPLASNGIDQLAGALAIRIPLAASLLRADQLRKSRGQTITSIISAVKRRAAVVVGACLLVWGTWIAVGWVQEILAEQERERKQGEKEERQSQDCAECGGDGIDGPLFLDCPICDGTGHPVIGSCRRCVKGWVQGRIWNSKCDICNGTGIGQ